jgi:hypothetical protein
MMFVASLTCGGNIAEVVYLKKNYARLFISIFLVKTYRRKQVQHEYPRIPVGKRRSKDKCRNNDSDIHPKVGIVQ